MKTFKQFNEGAMDFLKPKSEEEILKKLKGLNNLDKVLTISEFDLPEKYLPENIDKIRKLLIKRIRKNLKFISGNHNNYIRAVQIDCEVIIKYNNNHIHKVYSFDYDGVVVDSYNYTNMGVEKFHKSYDVSYEKLNIKKLTDIAAYLGRWLEKLNK